MQTVFTQLTPDSFPACYRQLLTLRFPLDVAQVLELRAVINHAADEHPEPDFTPDYREFRERRFAEMAQLDVDRPHHRERLVRVLALFRTLHYRHAARSRDEEISIRTALAINDRRDRRWRRGGQAFAALMGLSMFAWPAWPEAAQFLPYAALGCGVTALRCYRWPPRLTLERQGLERELSQLLRQRIAAVDWAVLVNQLALVLGFRRGTEVPVFHLDSAGEDPLPARFIH
jgi:hypothetical protein